MLNVCIYGYLTKFLTHNVGVCGKIYYHYDYINHLIDKVMRYSFETKANKIYANKVASYAEEDAAKRMAVYKAVGELFLLNFLLMLK